MAATEGLRHRRQHLHPSVPAASSNDDDDDEMLGRDGRQRAQSDSAARAGTGSGSDVSVLFRFVNQYVVRYCSRLRDAIRGLIGARRSEAEAHHVPPSSQTRAALEILDTIQKTPFNIEIDDHAAGLRELWALLGDGTPYEATGKQWGRIGFQGKDPATDFRGQGALGLRNMIHFARSHTEQATELVGSADGTLPYAIAVINIGAHLLQLLNAHAGRLGNALFEFTQSSSEALALFDELFSLVFVEFVAFHRQALTAYVRSGGIPALAVMQFNPIRMRFFETLAAQINDGSFLTTYVERVSSATGVADGPESIAPAPRQAAAGAGAGAGAGAAVAGGLKDVKVGMLVDLG